MVDKNVNRFTGKLIKLDDCTFAKTKDVLDGFLCTTKLNSHLHENVHDETDVTLFSRRNSLNEIRELQRLNIRRSLHRHSTHHLHTTHSLWHSTHHGTSHHRHSLLHSAHLHLWLTHTHASHGLHSTHLHLWLTHTTGRSTSHSGTKINNRSGSLDSTTKRLGHSVCNRTGNSFPDCIFLTGNIQTISEQSKCSLWHADHCLWLVYSLWRICCKARKLS